jgi:hypothetical protein
VGEEAVGVGCDVEFADGGYEGWFEGGRVEGAEVDACDFVFLVCFCGFLIEHGEAVSRAFWGGVF